MGVSLVVLDLLSLGILEGVWRTESCPGHEEPTLDLLERSLDLEIMGFELLKAGEFLSRKKCASQMCWSGVDGNRHCYCSPI